MREFIYTLEEPIIAGDKKMSKMTLFCPRLSHKSLVSRLQQNLMSTLKTIGDTKQAPITPPSEGEKEVKPSGESWSMMLAAQNPVGSDNYATFCEDFIQLLLSDGICKIDIHPLKDAWANLISNFDLDKMMGEYIAHFLLPAQISQAI